MILPDSTQGNDYIVESLVQAFYSVGSSEYASILWSLISNIYSFIVPKILMLIYKMDPTIIR